MPRDYVTRRDYDAWISECAALAVACGYPLQDTMINDSTGLILGPSQYEAFENGMWSREPCEIFAIFEALNEPAIQGLPQAALHWAEFSGLCDKLMIVHPGKFCSPHLHPRKTEYYEVVLGDMDVFYAPEILEDPALGISKEDLVVSYPVQPGSAWPDNIVLPKGREHTYERLTQYRRLKPGDPKFVMPRKYLHAFGCPKDARTPVVIRENSTYSHEPTDVGRETLLEAWQHIHDNTFLLEEINKGRLRNNIAES